MAFCYRSGEIGFAETVLDRPDGTIRVCASQKSVARLRLIVAARARHAYDGQTLLVPGVPEAADDDAAFEAMVRWRNWAFPRGRA